MLFRCITPPLGLGSPFWSKQEFRHIFFFWVRPIFILKKKKLKEKEFEWTKKKILIIISMSRKFFPFFVWKNALWPNTAKISYFRKPKTLKMLKRSFWSKSWKKNGLEEKEMWKRSKRGLVHHKTCEKIIVQLGGLCCRSNGNTVLRKQSITWNI